MRPISRRHKLLGTALGVVATGWLADFFAGGGEPAAVRAAVPPESTPMADATVLADNRAALLAFEHSGLPLTRSARHGVVELSFPVAAQAAQSGAFP